MKQWCCQCSLYWVSKQNRLYQNIYTRKALVLLVYLFTETFQQSKHFSSLLHLNRNIVFWIPMHFWCSEINEKAEYLTCLILVTINRIYTLSASFAGPVTCGNLLVPSQVPKQTPDCNQPEIRASWGIENCKLAKSCEMWNRTTQLEDNGHSPLELLITYIQACMHLCIKQYKHCKDKHH